MRERVVEPTGHALSLEARLDAVAKELEAVAKVLRVVTSAHKRAGKAASAGTIRDISKSLTTLAESSSQLVRAAAAAQRAWPEQEGLDADTYHDEIARRARLSGFEGVAIGDGEVLSYPVVVRFDAKDMSVKLGRKRITAIRPSHLLEQLRKERERSESGADSNIFLHVLEKAYLHLTLGQTGKAVSLKAMYDLLTLRPGQTREYDLGEFLMDVYRLDRKGPHETKRGLKIQLSASSSARGGRGFKIVTERGTEKTYATLVFYEARA